ncbi:ly-6/neurotoxin-like protein 1 [Eublepharis macularius]|uniref:Ly-6/neurotoxin-like protein 1 n=1 Tax=Eublepharis macularius TaxID=481883 RepID=A0AA97JBW2_EUBMA|nr:ly-6/neurotoxin-like protein 1 [Eublepharis macularius]
MNVILLLGFFNLLFFATAQGLLCNQCRSGNNCGREEPCTAKRGKCFTKTVYEAPKGKKLLWNSYGCVTSLNEYECDTLIMSVGLIFITTCCSSDKCNGHRAPFPPPNCTRGV